MSPAQLAEILQCPDPTAAGRWLAPLTAAMATWCINTVSRQAAFLATVGHESNGLFVLQENLNYSAKRLTDVWPSRFPSLAAATPYSRNPEALANFIYGGRLGNGPAASGDGWAFRGRGPIQITGRSNYIACVSALGMSLERLPEALLQPEGGSRSAAWFFSTRGCNELADRNDIIGVSRKINGGPIGLEDRRRRWHTALRILSSLNPKDQS